MEDEDGINVLLEKADLQQFLDRFVKEGATKVSHFVDVNEDLLAKMGLTQLQKTRIYRIYNDHYRPTPTLPSPSGNHKSVERFESDIDNYSNQQAGTSSRIDKSFCQPSNKKMKKQPRQAVLTFQGGKLQAVKNPSSVNEKKPWEKHLYPYPKTERMEFYNTLLKDIFTSTSNKDISYVREQQKFRWDVKVKLETLSNAIDFYENPASGVPKYRQIGKAQKKCEKDVCASLVNKVNGSVIVAEQLNKQLQQRRQRLVDSSTPSGFKKDSDDENKYLTTSIATLKNHLDKLVVIYDNLKHSHLTLSRSRAQPETTAKENARIKRGRKENSRKSKKQKRERLLTRCRELLSSLLVEKEVAAKLFASVKEGKQVPRELQIGQESQLPVQGLYTLKARYHSKALLHLQKAGVFGGEAFEHVNCAVHRLMTKNASDNKDDDFNDDGDNNVNDNERNFVVVDNDDDDEDDDDNNDDVDRIRKDKDIDESNSESDEE